MYILSELEREFSAFNFLSLEFMAFILFQMDHLLMFNLRETEDKVQSTVYWKMDFHSLSICRISFQWKLCTHCSQEHSQSRDMGLGCAVQTPLPHSNLLKTKCVPYAIPKGIELQNLNYIKPFPLV